MYAIRMWKIQSEMETSECQDILIANDCRHKSIKNVN